jgi:hypothetical protein
LAGSKWVDSALVFTSTIGTALDERNVRREFKSLLKSAELPEMRLHDLRHTTATLLLGQGVHPRVVMETLGNSQVSLTLDRYSHVPPGLQEEAAKSMDAATGCQIGCQPDEEESEDDQNVENFFGKCGEPPRNRTENPQIKSGPSSERDLADFSMILRIKLQNAAE